MNIEERIQNLEIKFSYMEEYTKELNQVILDQNDKIMELKKEFSKLNEQVDKKGSEILENQKPPHY